MVQPVGYAVTSQLLVALTVLSVHCYLARSSVFLVCILVVVVVVVCVCVCERERERERKVCVCAWGGGEVEPERDLLEIPTRS